MTTDARHNPAQSSPRREATAGFIDRFGDRRLYLITLLAALLSVAVILGLAYKVVDEASRAISKFGLGFLTTENWDPVHGQFGAAQFIYGTAVSSFGALLLATPLSIAIALFLTELAPAALAHPIGTLVELLAGIPSVILGLWGILVLGPASCSRHDRAGAALRARLDPAVRERSRRTRPLVCSRRW